jgi:hypothetical protein
MRKINKVKKSGNSNITVAMPGAMVLRIDAKAVKLTASRSSKKEPVTITRSDVVREAVEKFIGR